jgi:hypothetical protein
MDEAEATVTDDTSDDTAVDSFLPTIAECEFKTLPDGWKNYLPTKSTKRIIRTPPISTTSTP